MFGKVQPNLGPNNTYELVMFVSGLVIITILSAHIPLTTVSELGRVFACRSEIKRNANTAKATHLLIGRLHFIRI